MHSKKVARGFLFWFICKFMQIVVIAGVSVVITLSVIEVEKEEMFFETWRTMEKFYEVEEQLFQQKHGIIDKEMLDIAKESENISYL